MEWGSILSGIGSIAGAFGSKGGDGIDVSENVRLSKHMFDQQMANLRRHKIHPVYGLGAGQGTVTPVTTARGGGIDAASLGAGLGSIAQGLQKKPPQSPTQTAFEQLGLKEAQANVQGQNLQNDLLRLEIARQAQAMNAEPTAPAPGGQAGRSNKPGSPGDAADVEKTMLKLNAQGMETDVTGMPDVDPAQQKFGELGEIEVAARNWAERIRRNAAKYEAERRAARKKQYEQRRKRGQHQRFPFGESSRRRIYNW